MTTELEIIDLKVGEGKEAVKGALITTHYTGWLEDGTKFDSSIDRGSYFETVIGTGRVIKGWDQGIMGMKVGGKRKLIVPTHYFLNDDDNPSKSVPMPVLPTLYSSIGHRTQKVK